jgi:hypothetical protein
VKAGNAEFDRFARNITAPKLTKAKRTIEPNILNMARYVSICTIWMLILSD